MVSTAAPDDCMNLRRLKSINSRFGRCMHPILSHMVGSPLRWIDDCEQSASAHLRPMPRRASAGRPETNIFHKFGVLRARFAAVRSSTPVSGVSPVAHVTVRGRCNHTDPAEGCEHRNLPTVVWHANRCNRRGDAALVQLIASVVPTQGILSRRVLWLEVCAADRAFGRGL